MNINCRGALLGRIRPQQAARPKCLPCQRHAGTGACPAFKSARSDSAWHVLRAASVEAVDAVSTEEAQAPAVEQQSIAPDSKQQPKEGDGKQEKKKRAPNNDAPVWIVSKVATGALLARLAVRPEVALKAATADPETTYRALCTVANAQRSLLEEQPSSSVLYAPSAGPDGQLHMTIVTTQRSIPLDCYGQQIVAKASSEVEALLSQILNKLKTEGRAVVRGAGAKACAASAQALVAARQALAEQGYELAVLPRFVSVQSGKRGPDSQLTVLEQHVLRQELPAASIVMGNTLVDSQSADRAREKLDAQGRVRLLVPKGAVGQVPALLRALQMPQGDIKAGARQPWPKLLLLSFHGWQRRSHIEADGPPGTHEQDELLLGVRRAATSRLPVQPHQRPFNVNATTNADALAQAFRSQLLVSGGRGARTDGSAEAALTALLAAIGADGELEAQNDMKLGALVEAMPDKGAWMSSGSAAAAGGAGAAAGADDAGAGGAEGAGPGAVSGADAGIKLRMFLLELNELTQSALQVPACPLEVSVPPNHLARALKAAAAASLAVAGERSRGALLLLPSLRTFEGLPEEEPGLAADVGINLRIQRHLTELPELSTAPGSGQEGSEDLRQGSDGQGQVPLDELRVSSKTKVLKLRDAIVAKVMNGEGDGAILSFAEAPFVVAIALEALCRARARLAQLSPGRDVGAVVSTDSRETTRASGAAGVRTVFYLRLVPSGPAQT